MPGRHGGSHGGRNRQGKLNSETPGGFRNAALNSGTRNSETQAQELRNAELRNAVSEISIADPEFRNAEL